jgi:hypothetical protein
MMRDWISLCFVARGSTSADARLPRRCRSLVALVAASAAVVGCASSGIGAARTPRTGKELNLTEAQLQIKVRALADPFSGTIEQTVWRLRETTDDPTDHHHLLIWQINLINAFQRAIFQPNPVAALFDTWALVEQFREYVEAVGFHEMNQEQKRIVLDAIDGMDQALFAIAVEAVDEDDAREVRALIRGWAQQHPVRQFVVRDSPQSEMAKWSARADLGALATVKTLGATLDDVMARLDLYAEYVPKQASWHAQAVAYDWVGPHRSAQVLEDLSTTATAFDRIATSLEAYPDVVAGERRIVLEMVATEREKILSELLSKASELELFVENQRIDFMEQQFRAEREAVFEAIAAERAIIIAEAKQERAETIAELEAMADRLVERSAVGVVDHFFLRAVQLLAIGLIGFALIAVTIVAMWKRK